jgi:hypothetical protein
MDDHSQSTPNDIEQESLTWPFANVSHCKSSGGAFASKRQGLERGESCRAL